MRISACYIVKNEAENVKRSISSIRGQVDEIVVVDTGSTDRTVAIASGFGAKIYDFVWRDDFASARNYALSKVTGDWILLLDADEYFSADTSCNLRKVIGVYGESSCNGLLVKMDNIDAASGELLDSFYQLRLVRRQPGLAYQGRIHEELLCDGKSLDNLYKVSSDVLRIVHTGYSREISKAKAVRNLQILRADIADGRPEQELYRYLCDCYYGLGEQEKALEYAWLDVRQGRRAVSYGSQCHRKLLKHYAGRTDSISVHKRLKLVALTVKDFPEVPDFHAEYGECLAQFYCYQEASEELQQALSLYDGYDGLEPCLLTEEAVRQICSRMAFFSNMARKAAGLRISACLIARNEAENIVRWLDNVSSFADEIIVVDTGSQDETCAMVEHRLGKCYHYCWQNDFAAAKNEALAKATGEWVVFTDADEWFVSPQSVRGYLAFLQENNSSANAVLVPLENIDIDNNNHVLDRGSVVRLFRNGIGFRYTGAVHEQLTLNGKDDTGVVYHHADAALQLQHTGYSACYIQAKLQRNLCLLQEEMCKAASVAKYYYFLAETYFALGYADKALDNALLAVQSEFQPVGNEPGKIFIIALEAMQKLGYEADDKLAVAGAGVAACPVCYQLYGYKGFALMEMDRWQEALSCIEQAGERYDMTGSRSDEFLWRLQVAKAVCQKHAGQLTAARDVVQNVLKENKWYEDAIVALAGLYAGDEYEALLDYFMAEYTVEEYEALLSILELNGFYALSRQLGELTGNVAVVPEQAKLWYQGLITRKTDGMHEQMLPYLLGGLQQLFVALLGRRLNFADTMTRKQLALLPGALQNLVRLYHGRQDAVVPLYEDYVSMLDAVVTYGDEAMARKYLALSKDYFSTENVLKIVFTLQERDAAMLAGDLYLWLADNAKELPADFWFSYGVFCYSIGEYGEAVKVLDYAQRMGCTKTELAAYSAWSREAVQP